MMSSPAPGGSGGSGDKPPVLSRLMRRASKLVRRGGSKRGSISRTEEQPSEETTSAPAEAIPEQESMPPIETAKPVSKSEATAPALPIPAAIGQSIRDLRPYNARFAKTAAETSAIQEQKARILFAKYGLTIGPEEWTRPMTADTERVEKKIRMRVKRTCHHCQTFYGSDNICSNCQHKRCKKCPRHPSKRPKASEGRIMAIAVDPNPQQQMPLAIKSRRAVQDLQFKETTQRARRTCHQCGSLFEARGKVCANCQHHRCPKCLRDPPKLEKFPRGYPGDAEEHFPLAQRQRKIIRRRVRWTCHGCQELFIESDKICAKCGHERCNECPRDPPKKVKQAQDEDLLRRVEQRIQNIALAPSASAA